MFIEKQELKTVAYSYQINEITENDDDIVIQAIAAAIDEVQGYMRPNLQRKEFNDGRLIYDVGVIFSTTGTERNALLLEMTKSIALWYLVRLANVDMLYEQVKERYDRAIDWLKKVNKGDITLNLPTLTTDDSVNPNGSSTRLPFRFGSRKKFNHDTNYPDNEYYQQNNQ